LEKYEDEPDLVARSQQGDLQSFNRLVERYQTPLYNLCLRMLGSPQGAEDATQEAFISAYRSIRSFHGTAFRAWLFRIASNACYDELRRRKARPAHSIDEPQGASGRTIDVPEEGLTLDERAEQRELGDLLQAALLQIPEDQRLAIVLCDVQGFDYIEIAQAMNVSLGTVKSRIFRGRAHLRAVLLRSGGELLPDRLRQVSEG
jgi:RNA polymerase sigma-70 factor (ECF subfamily)